MNRIFFIKSVRGMEYLHCIIRSKIQDFHNGRESVFAWYNTGLQIQTNT